MIHSLERPTFPWLANHHRTLGCRGAFSLTELLVVIAIIIILAGLTITVVANVREQARRTACMSNLHQWGLAVLAAAQSNEGNLLSSPWDPTFPRAAPNYMPIDPPAAYLTWYDGNVASQFTLTNMADYMDGSERIRQAFIDAKASAAAGVKDLPVGALSAWRCPSQRGGAYFQAGSTFGPLWCDFIIGMGYSYFARTDLWDKYMGTNSMFLDPAWKSQLCGQTPTAKAVMMNDTLFSWMRPSYMGPNHIKSFGTTDARGDLRVMSGNNTLYGDGHVAWKPASEFNLVELMNPASTLSTVPHAHPQGHAESFEIW